MSTSAKAISVFRDVQDRLKKRFPSATFVEGQDSSGNPTSVFGTGVAGQFNAVLRAIPMDWSQNQDILGNSGQTFSITVLQMVTEAEATPANTHGVRLATAAALPACTAAGTGVGHTLTGNANGALTVDGVACAANDRVLVKNQVAADDNGIYDVTTVGSGGAAFVLTRSTDFDAAAAGEIVRGATAHVTAGTANAGTSWELTTSGAIVVDTTNLTFVKLASGNHPLTRQDWTNLLGELLRPMAISEHYECTAGAVPAVADITGTAVATFRDLYWNFQKSA
jgi:hypothetical protein